MLFIILGYLWYHTLPQRSRETINMNVYYISEKKQLSTQSFGSSTRRCTYGSWRKRHYNISFNGTWYFADNYFRKLSICYKLKTSNWLSNFLPILQLIIILTFKVLIDSLLLLVVRCREESKANFDWEFFHLHSVNSINVQNTP